MRLGDRVRLKHNYINPPTIILIGEVGTVEGAVSLGWMNPSKRIVVKWDNEDIGRTHHAEEDLIIT